MFFSRLAEADTYDAPARVLHWSVAVLLAAQFITAAVLPDIHVDTPPDLTINLHFNIGLAILVLMAVRLGRRWRHPVRVAPAQGADWERRLAQGVHRLFYLVLMLGPLLGWAAASAHGIPVRVLGLVALPALAPRKAAWGLLAGDIHGYAMWTLLGLVAAHAAAALYHHVVRRDPVLRRMLFR